jgi:inositol-phosphate phosphatase/L-galactose 1-phosphate phosphatase/histidinol-phosphatase
VPLWGTLVALLHNSRPVIGIIDVPALHERWIGVADGPTLRNETLCRTSGCRELREANLSATSPDMFSAGEFAIFDSLSKQARFRRFGGDCYLYAMLASGRIDAVIEAGLKPYDYLAAVPVITSAGGVITDWKGNPLTTASDGRVIAAATPALHEQLLAETSALAT